MSEQQQIPTTPMPVDVAQERAAVLNAEDDEWTYVVLASGFLEDFAFIEVYDGNLYLGLL